MHFLIFVRNFFRNFLNFPEICRFFFFEFSASSGEEFQPANISQEEFNDLMNDLMNECLGGTVRNDEPAQVPPNTATNLNDSLVTPHKQPDEPAISPIASNDKYTPTIRPTGVQVNSMPSTEQSPQPLQPLQPLQPPAALNLSADSYAQFYDPSAYSNCYYTPAKAVTPNYAIQSTYATSAEFGYSSFVTQHTPVYVTVLPDVTTTAAMPTTLMSAQMQPSSTLSVDELDTLNRQLDHGPAMKLIGYRDKRNRFKTATFSDLAAPAENDPPAQVRFVQLLLLLLLHRLLHLLLFLFLNLFPHPSSSFSYTSPSSCPAGHRDPSQCRQSKLTGFWPFFSHSAGIRRQRHWLHR